MDLSQLSLSESAIYDIDLRSGDDLLGECLDALELDTAYEFARFNGDFGSEASGEETTHAADMARIRFTVTRDHTIPQWDANSAGSPKPKSAQPKRITKPLSSNLRGTCNRTSPEERTVRQEKER